MNELLEYVGAEFRRLGTEHGRAATRSFHQPGQEVDLYGVRAPEVQRVAREVYARAKEWPIEDRDRRCEALLRSGKKGVGCLLKETYPQKPRNRTSQSCGALTFADSLADDLAQHLLDGLFRPGMPQGRRQFGQRLEHKAPLGHSGMWDFQVGRRDHGAPVQQDVHIDGARTLA